RQVASTRPSAGRYITIQPIKRSRSQVSSDDDVIWPEVVADGAGRPRILLYSTGICHDGAVIAVSQRRRYLLLDETRVGRRSWVLVRLVLLDQQRPLLPEPADFGRGHRDVCLREE